jgi:hypothetical protein
MHKRVALSALLTTIIATAIMVFAYYVRDAVTPKDFDSVPFWKERIQTQGAEEAYQELAESLQEEGQSKAHERAHTFGEALFLLVGIDGIEVCDEQFIYGCVHQVIGEAIAKDGIDSLPTIATRCGGDSQCLHGMGHGVMLWYGYDRPALSDAIRACGTLPPHDLFDGCLSGVFMEYNHHSVTNEGVSRVSLRQLEPNKLNEPCDSLSGETAALCYFWQTRLWKDLAYGTISDDELFRVLGARCKALRGIERRGCMAGIGPSTISVADYVPSAIARLCTATRGTEEEVTLCYAEAAKVLVGTVSTDAAKELCNVLSEKSSARCIAYTTNQKNPLTF